jgi:hypothetical protein
LSYSSGDRDTLAPAKAQAERVGFNRICLLACVAMLAIALRSSRAQESRPSLLDLADPREIATRELQQARQEVEQAQLAVRSAKAELDGFIAHHFEEHRARAAAKSQGPQVVSAPKPTADPEVEQLKGQIEGLTKERDELLSHYTPAHPEVAAAQGRIALASQKLAALAAANAGDALPEANEVAAAAAEQLAELSLAEKRYHEEVALQYQEILDRWQAAERNLQTALEIENAAAKRLAAFEVPSLDEAGQSSEPAATSQLNDSSASSPSSQRASQSLALAALLIALALAALAAVRLARSDSVFATADDVAAALAVPVVGIIPAIAARGSAAAPRSLLRSALLLVEIVLAIALLALVVSSLQRPGFLSQMFSDPIGTLRQLAGGK